MSSLDSLRAQHYPKLSDCSPSNEQSIVEIIWNTKSPDLKADLMQELFERMDIGNFHAISGIDKLSNKIANLTLSKKAKKGFPDLVSVVGLIPPSKIFARIKRVHELAKNCGCKLDLLEREKANPTIKGTRLLEEYLDHRSTLTVWKKLAGLIRVNTQPDFSTLNSTEDYRNKASQFSDWFNDHINQLINLEELDLTWCFLTSLPPEIGRLINLEMLYLTINNLVSLPPEIWQLINLSNLSLTANNLTFLPPEIGQLINLEKLYLVGNNLTSLPPEIGQLINLEQLCLTENNLTSLPPEIGNLIKLKCLYLEKNNLISLPPEIGNLINLKQLYLNKNNLDSLPPEIGQLTALWKLDVSDNYYLPYGYSLVFSYILEWTRPYLLTPLFSIMQKF